MITNSEVTIYHKSFDNNKKEEIWTRFNYNKAWFFGGKGAGINKGYDNANDVTVRLAYGNIENLNIDNFKIGDVIVQGNLNTDIDDPVDLINGGYLIYTITSVKNNTFGSEPHINIGGK